RRARHQRELRHRARGERGPEHDRAVEAHPRRRVPLPAEPAAPRALALGDDRRALRRARARQLARHALGRVDLLEPVQAPPRAAEVRRELGGAEAVGLGGERVAAGPAPLDTVAPAPQRPDPLPHRRARAAEAAGQLLAGERAARAAARALRTAAARSPPTSARWLSLMRMASSSPKRWFVPPPVRTAYLARARIPGSVLRVSRTTSGVPCTRFTYPRVSVAMPQRCWRRFRATRSPASSAWACPSSVASTCPGAARTPSAASTDTLTSPSRRNTRSRSGSPHTTSA